MKEIAVFNDTRLLESLDYIDRDLIAEVIDDLKVPDADEIPGNSKKAVWRTTKQFLMRLTIKFVNIIETPFVSLVTRVTNFPTGIWLSCSWESFSICANKSIRILDIIFCPIFCREIDCAYEQTIVTIKMLA